MLPTLVSIGPVRINSFGVVMVLAFVLGAFVYWKRMREEHYDQTLVMDSVFVSGFWAVVGARVVYVLANFGDFGDNVVSWFSLVSAPGLAWQGALLGGVWALVRICKKNKWEVFECLDLAAIGLSLSQAVMGLGLFLSGGGIGRVTSLPVGVVFPGVFEKRHPVGLYLLFMWLLVFVYLWWVEGRYRKFSWYQRSKGDAREGYLTGVYLVALGVIEMLVSLVGESGTALLGVGVAGWIGFGLLVVGLVVLGWRSGLKWFVAGKTIERRRSEQSKI